MCINDFPESYAYFVCELCSLLLGQQLLFIVKFSAKILFFFSILLCSLIEKLTEWQISWVNKI